LELERFVCWLRDKAAPYWEARFLRFYAKRPNRFYPPRFNKLRKAEFQWPRGKPSLTPKELASLIGCHPSLITKAINARRIFGQRRRRPVWRAEFGWVVSVKFRTFYFSWVGRRKVWVGF
jgi:hypothetical protein